MSIKPSGTSESPLDPANGVEVCDVAKRFRVMTETVGRATSFLLNRVGSRHLRSDLWALRDVSFNVRRGEILGLVGTNGSGKSTMLKIITGISRQTSGEVRRAPRVAALLDLAAGFHPRLTGYENIFLGGSLMGLSREEIREKLPEIVTFAGVGGDYLESPVRYYSTGMLTRLGFALAVSCDPDVVLVDEVLAVGDAEFQSRSARRLLEFRDQGKSMILVSHMVEIMRYIPDEVVWLENGGMRAIGPARDTVQKYETFLNHRIHNRRNMEELEGVKHPSIEKELQNLPPPKAEFISIELDDGKGLRPEKFQTGGVMRVRAEISAREPIASADLRLAVRLETGVVVDEFSASEKGAGLMDISGRIRVTVTLDPLLLHRGIYSLELVLVDGRDTKHGFAHSKAITFEVEMAAKGVPLYPADLPCEFSIE